MACRQPGVPGRVVRLGVSCLTAAVIVAHPSATDVAGSAADAERWFQATEQALMDAVGPGDKTVWERVMDPGCVVTSEEGQVLTKQQFLNELRPLPPGLTGGIKVRDLTVQDLTTFAVVRYVADEWESVFGQRLTTQYRTTDTFRRAGSGWTMVASHTAVVTRDPPAQSVSSSEWPRLVGEYRLLPDGWAFHVVLRNDRLYGGRDLDKLKPLIPLTPDAFVLEGSLGEWIFVAGEDRKAVRVLNFRKFEPLVWTRVGEGS
jgi:hypothetical protein